MVDLIKSTVDFIKSTVDLAKPSVEAFLENRKITLSHQLTLNCIENHLDLGLSLTALKTRGLEISLAQGFPLFGPLYLFNLRKKIHATNIAIRFGPQAATIGGKAP
jgi:hypothetical protein